MRLPCIDAAHSSLSHDARFGEIAQSLAEQIWKRRLHSKTGDLTWLRPGSPARGEPPSLQTKLDPYLYDGTAGIALFFAAAARVFGRPELRERSLAAIAPVRRKVAEIVADVGRAARLNLAIGGVIGIGSLIYSYVRIGILLDEQELVHEAHDLLALMSTERIERDSSHDVMYGGAGAILALLALHRSTRQRPIAAPDPLEIASACARRLLQCRTGFGDAPRAWQTLDGHPPLAGFSHGAAGICYALLSLFEVTQDPQLLEAAREGLAYERRLYCPEQRNWRDMRSSGEARFQVSWCHGAAGIALARIAIRRVLDRHDVHEDIDSGVEAIRSASLAPLDHICCGNMGRIDILHQAYLASDEGLRGAAEALACQTIRRAEMEGQFHLRPEGTADAFDPSFFSGAAGVGYVLLRLASPRELPCVLLLE